MIAFYLAFLAASSVLAVSYQILCLADYRKEKGKSTKAYAIA